MKRTIDLLAGKTNGIQDVNTSSTQSEQANKVKI